MSETSIPSSNWPPANAWIYVVFCEETGLHKIGRTRDLEQRMSQLRAGSAYVLWLRMSFTCPEFFVEAWEKALHYRFAACRTHGEWFKLTPRDLDWLNRQAFHSPLILEGCYVCGPQESLLGPGDEPLA